MTLKKLTESQLIVYQLLRILGGRANTIEIIGLAKKKHPNFQLYVHVRKLLDKLEENGYVGRDKNLLPYKWFLTKKLEALAS